MTVKTAASYEDALSMVLADVAMLSQESVALEHAIGRALATSVSSPIALPPWDNAGMDGYAVRREDVSNASLESPVMLTVLGESVAGATLSELPSVAAGQSVRIMTGAPVPLGADAVVRIEDTDAGTEFVSILNNRDSGRRGKHSFERAGSWRGRHRFRCRHNDLSVSPRRARQSWLFVCASTSSTTSSSVVRRK